MDKLISLEQIKQIIPKLKALNKKIVFTNGCFDIIHAGHVSYLKKAKQLGDILIVGLNSDKSIRLIKGEKRPINNQDDRACVLSAFYFVDYIVVFDQDTPYELIKAIQPDILVKGADWQGKHIVGQDLVEKSNGKVVLIDYLKNKSTTAVIDKILDIYGCT